MKKLKFFIIGLIFLTACSKTEKEEENVDRKAILINIGNVIFDNYKSFSSDADSLHISAINFNSDPNEENFNILKTYFIKTYASFQRVQFVNIGSALEINLIDAMNFYPEDTSIIMNAINSNSYNIQTINNKAKGLHALDYLLYGFRDYDESEIIDWYANDTNSTDYVLAVTGEIKRTSNTIKNEWETSYLETFKARQGIDKSSSFYILTNAMLENFEKYGRTAKVGIPLGYNGIFEGFTPRLNLVEGKYSNISLQLIESYILGFESILLGNNSLGYDDYLNQIDAKFNNIPLEEVLKTRINDIKTKLALLEEPYSEEITNDRQKVKDLFSAMQQLSITLKVDMASALSIDIIYQDSDGD